MFPKSSVTDLRRCCRQAIHREIDDYLLAAIFGQLDAAKILIQAGADLNSTSPEVPKSVSAGNLFAVFLNQLFENVRVWEVET